MKKIDELNAFIITNKEIKETLESIGWKNFISEIKKGFEESSIGSAVVPEKIYVNTGFSDMRCMPAYLPKYSPDYCGVKIVSVAPNNKKLGIPTVLGEYLLRDAKTQQLLAVMQAEEMTAYRTGAATGAATEILSRTDSEILGIIGAGKQAYYQAKAILSVRPYISRMKVYDISEEYALNFKEGYEKEFGVEISVSSLKDALDSDIITTITTSEKPFISSGLIKQGMHLNGVGADSKTKIEFSPDILKKSKVFVDALSQCMNSGEVYAGLSEKIISDKDLVSLGDVLAGKKEGRTNRNDVTFFKSTGVAFEDLITAVLVFEKLK